MNNAAGMLGKTKNWIKRKSSGEQTTLENVGKRSSKYGISLASDWENMDSNRITFLVRNHVISTEKLNEVDQLVNKSKDFHLSNKLANEITNSNGSKEEVDQLIKKTLEESANYGNRKSSKNLFGNTDEVNRLYAMSKISEQIGATWELEDSQEHGYRKKLVIKIDPEKNPEKQIKMIMNGLAIDSPVIIQAAIDRFNKKIHSSEQNPEHNITHTNPSKSDNNSLENKMKYEELSELSKDLKGIQEDSSSKSGSNLNLPNSASRSETLARS